MGPLPAGEIDLARAVTGDTFMIDDLNPSVDPHAVDRGVGPREDRLVPREAYPRTRRRCSGGGRLRDVGTADPGVLGHGVDPIAACRRGARRLQRPSVRAFLIAIARARALPTSTTSRRPRVIAVYSRFRCNMT